MIRLVQSRTLRDLDAAVLDLRELLAEADPNAASRSAAFGCVGCGAWMSDVVTRHGESWCWRCVRTHRIDGYLIMRGRSPMNRRDRRTRGRIYLGFALVLVALSFPLDGAAGLVCSLSGVVLSLAAMRNLRGGAR